MELPPTAAQDADGVPIRLADVQDRATPAGGPGHCQRIYFWRGGAAPAGAVVIQSARRWRPLLLGEGFQHMPGPPGRPRRPRGVDAHRRQQEVRPALRQRHQPVQGGKVDPGSRRGHPCFRSASADPPHLLRNQCSRVRQGCPSSGGERCRLSTMAMTSLGLPGTPGPTGYLWSQ